MSRFGAVPGQTPACMLLPVGKSVGFEVTIVFVVVVPPPSNPLSMVESITSVVEANDVSVVVVAVDTEPSALYVNFVVLVVSVPFIVPDMSVLSVVAVASFR